MRKARFDGDVEAVRGDSTLKMAWVLGCRLDRSAAIMGCVPQASHRSALARTAVDLLARARAGGEPPGPRGRSSSRDSIGARAGTPRARDSRALQELRFPVRRGEAVEAVPLSGVQGLAALRADAADRQDPTLTGFQGRRRRSTLTFRRDPGKRRRPSCFARKPCHWRTRGR